MNNWYYNEVELKNKHKMLNSAGVNHRRSKVARDGAQLGFVRRGAVLLARRLVDAGERVLNHHAMAPENEASLRTASPD